MTTLTRTGGRTGGVGGTTDNSLGWRLKYRELARAPAVLGRYRWRYYRCQFGRSGTTGEATGTTGNSLWVGLPKVGKGIGGTRPVLPAVLPLPEGLGGTTGRPGGTTAEERKASNNSERRD